ncbi:MAG: hypothetical protein AAGE93_14725, partial [Bacteroidota bacterium]
MIAQSFVDLPEDVDFYSFSLEAGQTVSLDIDTEQILPNTINARDVVYPALTDILQKPDTELRLFDAEGARCADADAIAEGGTGDVTADGTHGHGSQQILQGDVG